MWTTVIISGISLGSFYTLIALGFALIYGVTRNFNLAHGELVVMAGYVAYWLWKLYAWPLVVTFPVAIMAMLVVCLALQRLFAKLEAPLELNSIVMSFGVAIIAQNGMLFLFSGNYRLIRVSVFDRGYHYSGIYLGYGQLTLLILSLLTIILLYLLLRQTYLGKALRATIQDRESAALSGINVEVMGLVAFAIGAVLIGMAGPLYGCVHYLYPSTGYNITLVAITLTIFAGIGRIHGIILAGWLLGLAESFAVIHMGANWREMVSAVILLSVLAMKPYGILGDKES